MRGAGALFFFSASGFWGFYVRFLFCFRAASLVRGPFRPRLFRPVARLRPRCVVSPLAPRLFRVRRRGPVFVARRCGSVLPFLGSPPGSFCPVLCGAPGAGWGVRRPVVAGFRSGGRAARARWAWSRFPCAGRPLRCVLCPVRGRLVVPALSLFPAAALGAVVGFSGGRRLSPVFRPRVSGVVAASLAAGRSVAVGCAPGADSFVRGAAPGAVVFSAAAFGSGRAAFAARSVALVRAVAAGGPGSGFVVFPAAPCPGGLVPSASASACFCGLGSGSWASAALAAGLGLPVVVFPCGFSALPPWGVWRSAGSGVWAGGFLFSIK